jgi:hypothetical protein
MRKSEWLLATSILLVGLGFGHAGCYTSGLPGGHGAGGASASTSGGSGGSDASSESADGSTTCESNADCASHRSNPVCNPNGGQCVQCIVDSDCPADAGVDPYCLLNTCTFHVACQLPGQCPSPNSDQICDTSSKHCVACITNADCSTVGTACFANLCRTTCATSKSCTAPTTYCAIVDGGTGFCTETCAINSDCSPGYKCSNMACVLAN